MNIFDIHNIKTEKQNAMLQYRRFKNLTKLFRFIELFSALILLSWISTRLPFIINITCDYFRQLISVIVSPLFIFLIGNLIVLTLLLKSGQITSNFSVLDVAGSDLYDEIVNTVTEDTVTDTDPVPVPVHVPPVEIVYQDKQMISEVNSKPMVNYCCKENDEGMKKRLCDSVSDLDLKVYQRSRSENLMKIKGDLESDKVVDRKLKRSETEIGRRRDEATAEEEKSVVDELSNEEFQRRIEVFIAKQVRFHQEEKLSIVPHTHF
ncbi:hypothetical protein QVD17_10211 [Tagetes erecta]|uniref:DUF4408 domain-containing protein n=1 Tax=Tagetes erecta TaxID=13708 RepID=A0AAD8L5U9_TARER|nr:hypothetical protein QVD17_10211 [Tagetes erecta]